MLLVVGAGVGVVDITKLIWEYKFPKRIQIVLKYMRPCIFKNQKYLELPRRLPHCIIEVYVRSLRILNFELNMGFIMRMMTKLYETMENVFVSRTPPHSPYSTQNIVDIIH